MKRIPTATQIGLLKAVRDGHLFYREAQLRPRRVRGGWYRKDTGKGVDYRAVAALVQNGWAIGEPGDRRTITPAGIAALERYDRGLPAKVKTLRASRLTIIVDDPTEPG